MIKRMHVCGDAGRTLDEYLADGNKKMFGRYAVQVCAHKLFVRKVERIGIRRDLDRNLELYEAYEETESHHFPEDDVFYFDLSEFFEVGEDMTADEFEAVEREWKLARKHFRLNQ